MTTIIGSPVSPYVRKALVFLELKRVPYRVVPRIPMLGDAEFTRVSQRRRVPVLQDDRVTVQDSSVICQYLEYRHPEPPLYPKDVALRARARWYEEFADSTLGDCFVFNFCFQTMVNRAVLKEPLAEAIIECNLTVEMPKALDYLESEIPAEGWLCGDLSIADIAVAAFFRNGFLIRWTLDGARWPKLAAYVARVHALPPFAKLAPVEEKLLRLPPDEHLAAVAGLGEI